MRPEGGRHEPRHQLGTPAESDADLLDRLGEVLDRVDPMSPDLITTGRAVFTGNTDGAAPKNAGRPGSPVPGLPVQPPVQPPLPPVAEGWTGYQTAPGLGEEADAETAGTAAVRGTREWIPGSAGAVPARPETPHATGP